jgi:HlyD family secretion protein
MNKKFIYIIAGVVIVMAVIGGFFWYRSNQQAKAAGQYETAVLERGNLTSIVGATGTVRANQSASLNWQTSGTVESVNVSEGDIVKEGEELAGLSPTSLSQAIILAQADLVTAERNLQIVMDSTSAIAQAQLTLATAEKALKDATNKREGMNYKRSTQANIDYAEAQLALAEKAVDVAQSAFNNVTELARADPKRATATTNLYNAKLARDRALANLNWYRGKPSDNDVAEADGKLAVAQAQYDDALREWNRLKDGPDPKDIAAAKARVDAIKATLNMAHITAPFTGSITRSDPKPGDQVSPATPAFRLDDLSELLVDVQVSEVDINSVAPNQNVILTFDANPGQEYKGVVKNVGQVGNPTQGSVNFVVTVELTDPDNNVKPGMTAAVTINVKELADVLLVPNQAVRYQDAKRVVYVFKNGVLTPVDIQLGATSDTYSELISTDLKEGDEIVLNPPAFTFGPGGGGGGGGGVFGGDQ